MNFAAFDALIERLDAEIAVGPMSMTKTAGTPPFEAPLGMVTPSRASVDDASTRGWAVFALQPSSADLLGVGITPEAPCPPRPPEPPPATPQRSWLARLLFRRTR